MKKFLFLIFTFYLLFLIFTSIADATSPIREGRYWQTSQYPQNSQYIQQSQKSSDQPAPLYITVSGTHCYYSPNYIEGYTYSPKPAPGYYLYPKNYNNKDNYAYSNNYYSSSSYHSCTSTSHWPVATDYYTTAPTISTSSHWPVASDYYTTAPTISTLSHWPVASDYASDETKKYAPNYYYTGDNYIHPNNYNNDIYSYNSYYVDYNPTTYSIGSN